MKHIGVIVTVTLTVMGAMMGYGKLQAREETTREKVDKVEVVVDEHDNSIQELQRFDVKQSILIESSLKIIDKLERKLDGLPVSYRGDSIPASPSSGGEI